MVDISILTWFINQLISEGVPPCGATKRHRFNKAGVHALATYADCYIPYHTEQAPKPRTRSNITARNNKTVDALPHSLSDHKGG